jgi:cellulose synthase/poly-beta-1,6-N-acetylglucosamine synthase-like glycosyltransferase
MSTSISISIQLNQKEILGYKKVRPEVTLIMVTYEQPDTFFYSLQSALDQSISNFNLIIIDDHSVEWNFDMKSIKQYILMNKKNNLNDYQIIQNETNLGTVKSLNKALKNTVTNYYTVLSCDDILPKKSLEHLLENIIDSSLDLVSGEVYEFSSQKKMKSLRLFNYGLSDELFQEQNELSITERYRNLVLGKLPKFWLLGSILSTHKIKQIGGYDERFLLLEDRPLILKMINHNFKFGFIANEVYFYRNDSGMSNNKFNPASKKLIADYVTLLYDYKNDDYLSEILNVDCEIEKYELKNEFLHSVNLYSKISFLMRNFFVLAKLFIVYRITKKTIK